MSLHDASQEQLTDMLYAEGSTPPYWERRHIVEPQTGHFSNLLTKARVQWGLNPSPELFRDATRQQPTKSWAQVAYRPSFSQDGYTTLVLLTHEEFQKAALLNKRRFNIPRQVMAFCAALVNGLEVKIDALFPAGGSPFKQFVFTSVLLLSVAVGLYLLLTIFFPPLVALPLIGALVIHFSPAVLASLAIALPALTGVILGFFKDKPPETTSVLASGPARFFKFLLQCVTVPISLVGRVLTTTLGSLLEGIFSGFQLRPHVDVIPMGWFPGAKSRAMAAAEARWGISKPAASGAAARPGSPGASDAPGGVGGGPASADSVSVGGGTPSPGSRERAGSSAGDPPGDTAKGASEIVPGVVSPDLFRHYYPHQSQGQGQPRR